jgi:hypothetical protein
MSSSSSMRFHGIDEAEAERLLAAIWRVLEENDLATPQLHVRSAKTSIDVTLTFQSAQELALVKPVERAFTALAAVKADVAPRVIRTMADPGNRQETQHQIKRWRQRAEELRTVADQFVIPSAGETMRRTANNYERLADNAEALLEGRPATKKTDRTA